LTKKEKKKKKNWKEIQHEKQLRQQKAEEAHQTKEKREEEKKPRKRSKGKIILGFCMVAVMVMVYGAWQYYTQLPPSIGTSQEVSPSSSETTPGVPPSSSDEPTGSAPDFSLKDINGYKYALKQFNGKVIAIHFMAVGCGGQIRPINDHQLNQLRSLCDTHCGENRLAIFTIAVSTCEKNKLEKIRSLYNITWIYGNDYDDKKLDIIDAYEKYSIMDGTIVLIDKSFDVVNTYTEDVTGENFSSTIRQLLEA